MKGSRFLSGSTTRLELIWWIRRHIFFCKIFDSGLMLLKTSRPMPQNDSWSSPPATYWYTVTRTGTISTGLMWYLLMSPGSASTTLIVLFLGCSNPVAFQLHLKTFGRGYYSPTGWPWLISKCQMRTVCMVSVCCLCANMQRHWRWLGVILGHLPGCLEWYPLAAKHLWTIQTETQHPIHLSSLTLTPDTERNPFPLCYREGHGLLLVWLSSIGVHAATW